MLNHIFLGKGTLCVYREDLTLFIGSMATSVCKMHMNFADE
jgi:hypothetical protein